MSKMLQTNIIPDEAIISRIYLVRGEKVMLDSDLAELYDIETKYLKRAVKQNISRFPDDFMFELTKEEWESLRCNFSTSNKRGGTRYLPYVFTEQGVAMLSSVLNSEIAINVNIRIIRLFTKMREILMANKDLLLRMKKVERELASQGESIKAVFDYLDQFIKLHEAPRVKIGFKQKHEK
jgi:hypothetical protein